MFAEVEAWDNRRKTGDDNRQANECCAAVTFRQETRNRGHWNQKPNSRGGFTEAHRDLLESQPALPQRRSRNVLAGIRERPEPECFEYAGRSENDAGDGERQNCPRAKCYDSFTRSGHVAGAT